MILQNSWNGRRYVVKCNWTNMHWVVANVASGGIHFSRYLASLSCQWVQNNSWNPASADDTYTYTYNTHVTILFHLAFICWSPSTRTETEHSVLEWQRLFSLVYYTRYEVACKNRRLFLKLQAHIYPPKPVRLYKIILVQLFYSFFLSFCLFFDGLNFCLE